MKEEWEIKVFDDCVANIKYTNKVQRKDFLTQGRFPIVSQESDFINGYWNNENDLFLVQSPIVIFGDHTKVLKYIDFNFVLGADGVKILQPCDFLLPKYFYYQLQLAKLDSLGYARHYKLLKELKIAFPKSFLEQKRIVATLDKVFENIAIAKANAEQNLKNARELFESYLQSVFTQKGEGWTEKFLGEVCTFSSGGTPSKDNTSYWDGDIPWISGRDMKSTQLSDSFLHISRSAIDESSTRMAPAGTLLILVRGMGLAHGAQIAELMVPCAFNQDIKAIHPISTLLPRYLLFALKYKINSSGKVLSNAAHGTLKIDSDRLKSVMIPVPPITTQHSVLASIEALTEKTQHLESIYQQKIAALDELKKSLLHKAFKGEL